MANGQQYMVTGRSRVRGLSVHALKTIAGVGYIELCYERKLCHASVSRVQ